MTTTIRCLLGRPSRRLPVAVTMIAALLLAACGGGDAAEGPQASSASSASIVTTSEPSAEDEPSTSASEPSTTAARSISEHTNPPDADTTTSTTTSTTTTSTSATTASTTSSTTSPTTVTERPAGIDAWLGTFQWTEFAAGDPGSDQTIVHELILTNQSADGSLAGTFTQSGFQTNISLEVVAHPGETGVTVFAASDGPPLYTVDQRLFALSGDPNAPTTSLGAVQPFLATSAPQMGSYFTR